MRVDKVTMKFGGVSYEWPITDLDLSPDSPPDNEVLAAVTQKLNTTRGESITLTGMVIDPRESERLGGQHDDKTVLNVRPEATYG